MCLCVYVGMEGGQIEECKWSVDRRSLASSTKMNRGRVDKKTGEDCEGQCAKVELGKLRSIRETETRVRRIPLLRSIRRGSACILLCTNPPSKTSSPNRVLKRSLANPELLCRVLRDSNDDSSIHRLPTRYQPRIPAWVVLFTETT